jgi:hypothetical protein
LEDEVQNFQVLNRRAASKKRAKNEKRQPKIEPPPLQVKKYFIARIISKNAFFSLSDSGVWHSGAFYPFFSEKRGIDIYALTEVWAAGSLAI